MAENAILPDPLEPPRGQKVKKRAGIVTRITQTGMLQKYFALGTYIVQCIGIGVLLEDEVES